MKMKRTKKWIFLYFIQKLIDKRINDEITIALSDFTRKMVDACGIMGIIFAGFGLCYVSCKYCSSPKCEAMNCKCDCTKCCTICKKCCTCDSSNRVQQQNTQATDTVITIEPLPYVSDVPVYGEDAKYDLPSYEEVAVVFEIEPVICNRLEILPPPSYGESGI